MGKRWRKPPPQDRSASDRPPHARACYAQAHLQQRCGLMIALMADAACFQHGKAKLHHEDDAAAHDCPGGICWIVLKRHCLPSVRQARCSLSGSVTITVTSTADLKLYAA